MWVVEYSKSQKCFHVDTLESSVQKNNAAFSADRNKIPDFIIIHIANSYEEAMDMCYIYDGKKKN